MKSRNICNFVSSPAIENLEIVRFVYETNLNSMKNPPTLHHHRMLLIKQGNGFLKMDNSSFPFQAGNLFFFFSGEKFCCEPSDNSEYMYIDFSGVRADALLRRFGINKNFRKFQNFDGLIPLWHNSLSRASQENSDLSSESILLYTFSRLTGCSPGQNNLLSRMIEITEEQFTNPELSISAIADELSYNSKYLSHLFKQKMGMGYSEYLKDFRVKYAVTLLEHGIDSVKSVAFLSGFSDPLYFSKVFKNSVGVSPKDYKNR